MNYFVEGLQGSGKSTLVEKLAKGLKEKHPDLKPIREGDYSPVDLAWCAYVDRPTFHTIMTKYPSLRDQLMEKSVVEKGVATRPDSGGDHLDHESDSVGDEANHKSDKVEKGKRDRIVIPYTQIITDTPNFHKDLEKYEIYNGRVPSPVFRNTVLSRYHRWAENQGSMIFDGNLFQNVVQDMMLFQLCSDEEILGFYRQTERIIQDYRIIYLKTDDVHASIQGVAAERSESHWFQMMLRFFEASPYAVKNGLSGETALLGYLTHRQKLELRICREVFEGKCTILRSKGYNVKEVLEG